MDFFSAAAAVLSAGWQAITAINYPGTSLPIAAILVGAFSAAFSLRVIGYVLGLRYSYGSVVPRPKSNSGGDAQCPGQMRLF